MWNADLDRFHLPFQPDRPTAASCAYCLDDIMAGDEAYVNAERETVACSIWCATNLTGGAMAFDRVVLDD